MAAGLRLSVEGPVVRAVLDLGEGNLLDAACIEELVRVLTDPPEGTRMLRLSAIGEAFCLGRERAAEAPDELRREVGRLVNLNRALGSSPLVTIAEVAGDAAGFGVGLVALSDVAVTVPEARLWFPEVEIDLAPVVVLTWLPRLVGRRVAFELTATGRRVAAGEAVDLGLVNEVVPAESLGEAVDRWVDLLSGFSARVHREIKDYLRATQGLDEDRAYELALDRLVVGSMRRRR